jgi:hypothetical protein
MFLKYTLSAKNDVPYEISGSQLTVRELLWVQTNFRGSFFQFIGESKKLPFRDFAQVEDPWSNVMIQILLSNVFLLKLIDQ